MRHPFWLGLLCFLPPLQAQEISFPVPLLPGDRFTVQESYNGTRVDTLWLLNKHQLRNFIIRAMKQEIDSARADLLRQQVDLYKKKTEQMAEIIDLRKKGYLHYRDLWLKTDAELEKAEIRAERNLRIGFLSGVLLSAALVILLK